MRRQTLSAISTALFLALILSTAAVLPVTGQDTGTIIGKLEQLHGKLEGEKPALQNKVNAVIHQIEAGAFNGAVNKLQNDVKKSITAWVENPEELIQLIDEIIDLINGIKPPPPPTPDFEISTPPYQLDVLQGVFNTTTVTVTSTNNFDKEVSLTATTTAPQVTLAFAPETLQPQPNGSETSTLKVEAAINALTGEYEITVTGKSGSLEHHAIIPLRIIEAPNPPPPPKDFKISASPPALTTQQGRSNTSIITVTSVNGFDAQVDLAVTSTAIADVNVTLNPDELIPPKDGYAISVMVIDVATDALPGTHSITIEGTSQSLDHSVNITLAIVKPPVPPKPDFSLNAFPTTLTIEQGDKATSTIIATSLRGFTGAVTLALTSGPISGVTLGLDPTQITLLPDSIATSTLKIEVAKDTTPSEFAVTITGTSGTLQHSTSISITIILEKRPPRIMSVSRLPEDAPKYNQSVTVWANVVDLESGVKDVTLLYSGGADQQTTAMTLDAGLYKATIPAFPFNQTVNYRVEASDKVGNHAGSSTYSYLVSDPYAPLIETPAWSPREPVANEDIKINVTVTEPEDSSGIEQVILHYSNDTATISIPMIDNHDGNWTAVISNQTGPKVVFLVEAIDHAGNAIESEDQEINVATPGSPLAWILAAIAILSAATGGGAYYVRRKRRKGATATSVPSAAVEPIPPPR